MTKSERVREVVKWIIFNNYSKNETELAQKLGYTKSSFSQITNGRVLIADKFVKKLVDFNENINRDWIEKENGDMINRNTVPNFYKSSPEIEMEYMKRISELQEQLIKAGEREKELLIKLYGDKYQK
jgi:transcriptional regulator with XRE-family HTH domain